MGHEYVPRADRFMTEAVDEEGQRKSGIPCEICAQFEWNHEPEVEVKVSKTAPKKRSTSKPKAKRSTTKPRKK
jgi:hypothetical protein